MKGMERQKKLEIIVDYLFVIMVGTLALCWACHMRQTWAPDEYMRDDIPLWIVSNGRLPIGNEPELLNPIWGFSYAFVPYLPSLIGAALIKLFSVFTSADIAALLALRMVSVLSGMGTALFSLKIGKRLFDNRFSVYVFAAFICLFPQYLFLSSYFNNDSFSVFTTTVILYFWICGMQDGWKVSNSIGLGIGLGICALTYYNAYGYILCSVIFYVFSWIRRGEKFRTKEFLKYGIIIAGVAFLIAGWYFIRNAVIYQGDFLGLESMNSCGELNALEEFRPSNRQTVQRRGLSVIDMLRDNQWIRSVVISFVGCFGYMTVQISHVVVLVYCLVLGGGACIGMVLMSRNKTTRLLTGCLILTMIIPVLLMVYSSYAVDYQPQGRYAMSALPGLSLLAASGYDGILKKLDKRIKNILLGMLLLGWILLLAYVFFSTILPECWSREIAQILL